MMMEHLEKQEDYTLAAEYIEKSDLRPDKFCGMKYSNANYLLA